jgi:hypothetical protein
MLKAVYNDCKSLAAILAQEDGVVYSTPGRDNITLMLDRYCLAKDSNDSRAKDLYISGLLLRFWAKIDLIVKRCAALGMDRAEGFNCLYEAFELCCQYRGWQNPDKHLNAEQAITQCINTIIVRRFYDANLDKHKMNISAISLETPIDDDNGSELGETLEDEGFREDFEQLEADLAVHEIIQRHLNNRKIRQAIILDAIAYHDMQKVTKETVVIKDTDGKDRKVQQFYSEFWRRKCIQYLSELPENFMDTFQKRYRVNLPELTAAVRTIQATPNPKLYRFLDRTLADAKAILLPCLTH